jgi:hypothetical protein
MGRNAGEGEPDHSIDEPGGEKVRSHLTGDGSQLDHVEPDDPRALGHRAQQTTSSYQSSPPGSGVPVAGTYAGSSPSRST